MAVINERFEGVGGARTEKDRVDFVIYRLFFFNNFRFSANGKGSFLYISPWQI